MKNRILLLLILWLWLSGGGTLRSQVEEHFDNGSFPHDPPWQGDLDRFNINSNGMLQLNDAVQRSSYLSTPSTRVVDTEWQFRVKIDYNTSSRNYVKFYLASDLPHLNSTSLKGYFVRVGHTDDNICLFVQSGSKSQVITTGPKGRTDSKENDLVVKVTRDKSGRWKVWSKLLTESSFRKEGEAVENTFITSSHIGPVCVYAGGQGKLYSFDDIMVKQADGTDPEDPENPDEPDPPVIDPSDTTPPTLLSVVPSSEHELLLTFDEPIDTSHATFSLLSPKESPAAIHLNNGKTLLTLTFATPFTKNEERALQVSSIRDLNGNMLVTRSYLFTFQGSEVSTPERFADVVFTEIMANPIGAATLPEVEYVELYNRTDRAIDLKEWNFVYDGKTRSLPAYSLPPQTYVVLCNSSKASMFGPEVPVLGVPSFPVLANTGKLIELTDRQGKNIAWADYSDRWIDDTAKKNGGWSMESVDQDNLSGNPNNWRASISTSGGTPGRINSVAQPNPDTEAPVVRSVGVKEGNSVVIAFSEPMNVEELSDPSNYSVEAPYEIERLGIDVPKGMFVELILDKPVSDDQPLTFSLTPMCDLSGLRLPASSLQQTVVNSSPAEWSDILFNELMFNPSAEGVQYLELYNRSNKFIDLSSLFFYNRNNSGELANETPLSSFPTLLPPQSFRVFTTNASRLISVYPSANPEKIVELNRLPSMPKTSGTVVLCNTDKLPIDEFTYKETMHSVAATARQGVALERRSADQPTQEALNWRSASSVSGYGTPGEENSIGDPTGIEEERGFWLESDLIYLNVSGSENTLRLFYKLTDADYRATVRIFDTGGRLIATPANNLSIGSKGEISWSLSESGLSSSAVGLYILHIQYYGSGRATQQKRVPFVITTTR